MARELRLLSLATLVAVPLTWSSILGAETRAETVTLALGSLLLGTLPLFAALLLYRDTFDAESPEVRYGQNRRAFAARALFGHAAWTILFATVSATFAIALHRGPRDPLLFRDLLATLSIALAGSLALLGFLAFGRYWLGKIGLIAALILTWLLGSLDVPISAAVPTGHIRSLLGVGAELPFAPWVSFLCLYATTLLMGGAALLRVPR